MTQLRDVIRAVCEKMHASVDELNRLDSEAGDGDLGVTMSSAAASVLAQLPDLERRAPGDVLKTLGMTVARDAPSTCGTLLASGLIRAGVALEKDPSLRVGRLLEIASEAIMARGKAEPGSKTLLDALVPAAQAAEGADNIRDALSAAASGADAGARATVTMHPRHGRAGWLAERSLGHEDAGARLVAMILKAASHAA